MTLEYELRFQQHKGPQTAMRSLSLVEVRNYNADYSQSERKTQV